MSGQVNLAKRRESKIVHAQSARDLARCYGRIADFLQSDFPEAAHVIRQEAARQGLPPPSGKKPVAENLMRAAIVAVVNLLHRKGSLDAARKLVQAGGRI